MILITLSIYKRSLGLISLAQNYNERLGLDPKQTRQTAVKREFVKEICRSSAERSASRPSVYFESSVDVGCGESAGTCSMCRNACTSDLRLMADKHESCPGRLRICDLVIKTQYSLRIHCFLVEQHTRNIDFSSHLEPSTVQQHPLYSNRCNS